MKCSKNALDPTIREIGDSLRYWLRVMILYRKSTWADVEWSARCSHGGGEVLIEGTEHEPEAATTSRGAGVQGRSARGGTRCWPTCCVGCWAAITRRARKCRSARNRCKSTCCCCTGRRANCRRPSGESSRGWWSTWASLPWSSSRASETLRAGDFQTFLPYALLYRAQNDALLAPDRLHLLVLTLCGQDGARCASLT